MRRGIALTLLLLLAPITKAGDWPQFRGPNCSGIAVGNHPLPVKFSQKKNVAWSKSLGDSIASPVVAAGRVFTTAYTDNTIAVYCFDTKSGKQLWMKKFGTGDLPDIHKTNSHASTTPAADSERVYFYFSTLGMLALKADSGDLAWQKKLPVPYFVFKWGAGMSPVVYKDKLLFVQDDDLHPAFYAFDKRNGNILWRDNRDDMAVNYSHPVICQTKKGDEIVVAGTGKLIGYDPQNGKRLWYARTLLRNIKTTPVSHNGVIYVSLESGGIANQWLATADKNSDGRLTKEEIQKFVGKAKVPAAFFAKFERGDVNKDGFLEGEELDRAFLHPDNFAGAAWNEANPSQRFIQAIRGGGRGDVTKTHVLWNHPDRTPDHIVSPLVVKDRMFVVKGGGISSCFNTQNGKPFWRMKRIQNIGEYFGSPVYGDGKIYVVGENGIVIVMQSGRKLKILAKNDLGDSCVSTPAISDGRIFFRTRTKLICIAK